MNSYEIYRNAVGNTTFNDHPMLPWDEFSSDSNNKRQIDAWKKIDEDNPKYRPLENYRYNKDGNIKCECNECEQGYIITGEVHRLGAYLFCTDCANKVGRMGNKM